MAYEREAQTDIADLKRQAAALTEAATPAGYEREAQSDVRQLQRLVLGLPDADSFGGYERVGQTDVAALRRKLRSGGGPPLATGYSLIGPSGGMVGTSSMPFIVTLTPSGGTVTGIVTVTPNDGGGGGTFAPTSVGLTTATPSATFTYTPASSGAKTISTTNNGGLTNPTPLTYTATSTGLSDGATVVTWQDSSGNGHTANKTGTPIFKINIVNGKPAVRLTSATFDGFNLASVISGAAPWTIFAVMKATGTTVKCWSLVAIGSSPFGPVELGGTLYVADRTSYQTVPTDYSGAFHVFTGTSFGSGGVMELWVDGTSVGSSGPLTATSFDFGQIGYRDDPLYSDGDIAEIVFCNQDADGLAANRANIEKTLSVKYGTPTPPAGSVIDFSTLTTGWWKADSLG